MRASCDLAARVLTMAGNMVAPGVTTEEIDKAVHEMTVAEGAYPSPLRYGDPPFPKSVCTSVNECICHGIPDGRPLQDGDIVNIDVTVWLDGYHGDTSRCAGHWNSQCSSHSAWPCSVLAFPSAMMQHLCAGHSGYGVCHAAARVPLYHA